MWDILNTKYWRCNVKHFRSNCETSASFTKIALDVVYGNFYGFKKYGFMIVFNKSGLTELFRARDASWTKVQKMD